MAKFMLLYVSPVTPEEMMADVSPEDMQKMMEPWMAWFGKMGSAFVDMGTPLGHGANVTKEGSSASKTQIAGYSIIEAADLDAAKALVADHPQFMMPGGSIDILEILPMPSM